MRELQKEIIKAQRMMYLLNKSIKQFNTLDKILDKKIEKNIISNKNEYQYYNDYYSKFNEWCKDIIENYKNDIDNYVKYMSSIKIDDFEKESLDNLLKKIPNIDKIKEITNDDYYNNIETNTKIFLEKIKFSIADSINDELLEDPEFYNILEQLEILDESQSLKVIKSKEKTKVKQPNNVKQVRKLKSLDRQKTFAEREIIRKQQQKYTKEKIIHNITH